MPAMDAQFFAKILIGLVMLGAVLGIVGVWFPDLFKNDIGPKCVYTFIVIAVAVAISTGLLTYLPGLK